MILRGFLLFDYNGNCFRETAGKALYHVRSKEAGFLDESWEYLNITWMDRRAMPAGQA